jgi:hypothetical protein
VFGGPSTNTSIAERPILVCLSSTPSNGEGIRELGAPIADFMRR